MSILSPFPHHRNNSSPHTIHRCSIIIILSILFIGARERWIFIGLLCPGDDQLSMNLTKKRASRKEWSVWAGGLFLGVVPKPEEMNGSARSLLFWTRCMCTHAQLLPFLQSSSQLYFLSRRENNADSLSVAFPPPKTNHLE